MLDVMIRLGDIVFQSSEVIGAVCSGDLELDKSASGESLAGGASLGLEGRVIELELCKVWVLGSDHSRR
jgi:hypothetical protein